MSLLPAMPEEPEQGYPPVCGCGAVDDRDHLRGCEEAPSAAPWGSNPAEYGDDIPW